MRMHNLPHPGEILSELWLAHGLIYTKAKLAQCISRKTLSKIVNGNSGISPKMAFRQSIAFGGSPGSWMGHQVAPDNGLWQVKQHKHELNIKPFLAHGLHCAPSPEQQSKSYRLNIQRGQICCWLLIVSVLQIPIMSRPLRIEYPGAWYHVMNRGKRRENIILDSKDYETFIRLLQQTDERWNIKIAAYCLMSNHYHLLVHTPIDNLSRCMRHINGVYTQRFNRCHDKDGQLFRGRYKAVLIDADSHLLEVLRYIHKKPPI